MAKSKKLALVRLHELAPGLYTIIIRGFRPRSTS